MYFKIICGVALLLVIVILVFLQLRRSKSETSSASQRAESTRPKPAGDHDMITALCGDLADLMLKLRVSGASQAVSDAVKEIVVALTMLLPRFNEKYSYSELAFVLVQIGKNYLPNLLSPFSMMSAEAKVQNEQELLSSLAPLKKEIDKIQGILDRGEVDRFETEATFLSQRFLRESVEAREMGGVSDEGS